MGVVISRVSVNIFSMALQEQIESNLQPINPDGGQVLDVEGDQGTSEAVAHIIHLLSLELVLEFTCKPVSFPLKVPADRVHADANDGLERGQDHL
jgi:hypothetical protein